MESQSQSELSTDKEMKYKGYSPVKTNNPLKIRPICDMTTIALSVFLLIGLSSLIFLIIYLINNSTTEPSQVQGPVYVPAPTLLPTTRAPTNPTTNSPFPEPTFTPTTRTPTKNPTREPSLRPTTRTPTSPPTRLPTDNPVTQAPSDTPTPQPTDNPTTGTPTKPPTPHPTIE